MLWHAEQKFSDLTNRVEKLETELIAMKLCKLKMEARQDRGGAAGQGDGEDADQPAEWPLITGI